MGVDAEPFKEKKRKKKKKKLAESARVRRVWNIACTCDLWIIFRSTRSGSGYRQEPHLHGPTKTEDNMFASSPMTRLRYGETLSPTGIVQLKMSLSSKTCDGRPSSQTKYLFSRTILAGWNLEGSFRQPTGCVFFGRARVIRSGLLTMPRAGLGEPPADDDCYRMR